MSLLIDYTLTVAVSVAAGVSAITSVFPGLTPHTTQIAIALVHRSSPTGTCAASGKRAGSFAVPTYFFIVNMVALMAVGLYRAIDGTLHAHAITGQGTAGNPTVHIGSPGAGCSTAPPSSWSCGPSPRGVRP